MPFSISFLDEPVFYDEDRPLAFGEIVLSNHRENFDANLFEWTKQDYETQWRKAIQLVLEGQKSALMVYYVSPAASPNFEWWAMYPVGDVVYFQNHLPWYENLTRPFSVEFMFSFVPDRVIVNESGEKPSEWTVSRSDIEDFANTLVS